MTRLRAKPEFIDHAAPGRLRLGCVRYLNAKPLIDGLELGEHETLDLAVPSRLLAGLEGGQTDMSLCPVIDYQLSRVPLVVVPVGGIGCHGPTMTVRLFSQVPLDRISCLHVDTDSHTSVTLAQILLAKRHGVRPVIFKLPTVCPAPSSDNQEDGPQAMLLIGDKVVTHRPDAHRYVFDVDLGQAWFELTGLPFVFAVWLARADIPLGDWPEKLLRLRLSNQQRLEPIASRHAPDLGWPLDLAKQYLAHWLHYEIGPLQLSAMERFWQEAHELGLIHALKAMTLHRSPK